MKGAVVGQEFTHLSAHNQGIVPAKGALQRLEFGKIDMIFRTLLANFVVMGLPILLVAGGILLVLKSRNTNTCANARFWTGVFLLSVPLGLVAYIGSGMIAAALRGEGHFYSVPFGGYTASNDAALLTSAVLWIVLVFICLAAILRPRN